MAAVTVALRNGLDNTTTEAIAIEAGISTRTFFNYYNNKHAAILGDAVRIDLIGAGWFAGSQNPVIDDLAHLLGQAAHDHPLDRALLLKILAVIEAHPALQEMFRTRLDETTVLVTEMLNARLGDDMAVEARLLASLATQALTEAVMTWVADDSLGLDAITTLIATRLRSVTQILMQSDTHAGPL
ncbi:TetR/AcrR family transcriptional regulator [Pseudosulfitobacter pseudonitzschiae]|uniref:TetR/AcrR family transcriptional regulator n=1 Tax=Pseudosulfitobacter pseudonitzschiae TaxID=1402135 RepID=UPI001CCDA879|nr:TetR family transcriptional regulator [Pseudosulfitobacter pseudonitzschiae]MBM1817627.1 TetR family transcriptional regulator [Pseudosulfitobacter pseudonitzschiae]MBM1834538.1 TetR family transcriptional regulator [Pseudosulfitobacter pseudonitzschiae]MBM1839403.1 TetR family transcriptional regulator [Pseudosulfitobacter pseudonitzschiae]MBM1844253.1 TetR family transcriptional regulator [Pseudosulfitobacter pseudonitzschiae]MBM1849088.1 TetR family transcriptional regulator [Pseudosulfi